MRARFKWGNIDLACFSIFRICQHSFSLRVVPAPDWSVKRFRQDDAKGEKTDDQRGNSFCIQKKKRKRKKVQGKLDGSTCGRLVMNEKTPPRSSCFYNPKNFDKKKTKQNRTNNSSCL